MYKILQISWFINVERTQYKYVVAVCSEQQWRYNSMKVDSRSYFTQQPVNLVYYIGLIKASPVSIQYLRSKLPVCSFEEQNLEQVPYHTGTLNLNLIFLSIGPVSQQRWQSQKQFTGKQQE